MCRLLSPKVPKASRDASAGTTSTRVEKLQQSCRKKLRELWRPPQCWRAAFSLWWANIAGSVHRPLEGGSAALKLFIFSNFVFWYYVRLQISSPWPPHMYDVVTKVTVVRVRLGFEGGNGDPSIPGGWSPVSSVSPRCSGTCCPPWLILKSSKGAVSEEMMRSGLFEAEGVLRLTTQMTSDLWPLVDVWCGCSSCSRSLSYEWEAVFKRFYQKK